LRPLCQVEVLAKTQEKRKNVTLYILGDPG
jgi:hypothetical protein